MTPLPRGTWVIKFIYTESRIVVATNQGEEGNEDLGFKEDRLSVWDDENILEMNDSEGCSTM